jgi:Raf kinase inhibitor-like YbhB/YbcL family protein
METMALTVRSLAFSQGGHIPPQYTCNGENTNPPLEVSGYPEGAKTWAIITEDPDAPSGVFTHWLAWNLPLNEPVSEGYVPGISGRNSFGNIGYGGPCPPSGTHRYFFRAYALDAELSLPEGASKEALQAAMQGHVLAKGELVGLCTKQ